MAMSVPLEPNPALRSRPHQHAHMWDLKSPWTIRDTLRHMSPLPSAQGPDGHPQGTGAGELLALA